MARPKHRCARLRFGRHGGPGRRRARSRPSPAASGECATRLAIEAELRDANAKLQAAVDNFPGGITFVDSDFQMLGCNSRYRELLDLPEEMFSDGLPNLLDVFRYNAERGEYGPGDVEEMVRERRDRAMIPEPHVFERTRPNGVTLEVRGMPLPGGGWVTNYTDVTEQARARDLLLEKSRLLERTSRELQITLAHMNQGISVYDPDGRIVVWNMQYVHMFGMQLDDVQPGTTLVELLLLQQAAGNFAGDPEAYVEQIAAAIALGENFEATVQIGPGRIIKTIHSPRPDGGWVATHEDVTEREQAAARIAHAARHDMLTGLLNRVGLKNRLEAALGAAQNGHGFAILLVDLDRFKAVNDTFGHAVGDLLLKQVAERMQASVRERDVVARLGGDEFAVLCAHTPEARESAIVIAARMLASVSAGYVIDGHQLMIGASIGIALAPAHGATADELMRNADSALYEVKAKGRNNFRVFDERLASAAQDRRELERDLRDALARNEFELYYQPIVSVADRRVVAMEALLRWRHPTRGFVDPEVFIPIAEQSGLIRPIGTWVIRTAFADAATWPPHVRVAINVSPAQLGHPGIVGVITRELLQARMSPGRVEIEVTESVLLGKDETVLGELHELRSLDIRVALDDFGTGYSSMSYLRAFPFDKIKIDRSFVEDIETSRHCAAIVHAVTALAGSLGIETTAEGVETETQLALLTAAGCSTVQGYLFGRPRPGSEIRSVIGERRSDQRQPATRGKETA